MINSSLFWNLKFMTQKLMIVSLQFAVYNKMINSSLIWNLKFMTQKLIDRKFRICSL